MTLWETNESRVIKELNINLRIWVKPRPKLQLHDNNVFCTLHDHIFIIIPHKTIAA